ncbi:uncharacterized protein LOC110461807 [Mizuhopecten yessoensis]|uniref:uncharacterized protein LOC110461807 n=1 Tax=Mizuhopecten yessoensis TaxID=6573 RepID=UPI000B45BB1D|nr:uncharacterized protein LOC110461807 [Mizuhopecten yessoensis]
MSSRPFVTRRLSNGHERVDIVCPDNHVMLSPYIAYGASVGRRSSTLRLERDCLGTDSQLVKQSEQCVMNNTCSVSFRKGLRLTNILRGPINKCLKKFPKFLTISLPKCVQRDQIRDICSDGLEARYTAGILGRHEDIPNTNQAERSCHKMMSFLTNVTMSMKLEKFDSGTSYHVIIQWTTQHGTIGTRTLRYNHETFTGTGNHFDVTWENRDQDVSKPDFYLIYNVQRHDGYPNWSALHSPVPDLPKASLRSPMIWKNNQMSFTCLKGSLLYSPQLMVGFGKRLTSAVITPSLMVQINNCYWERNCKINWKIPATVTLCDYLPCRRRPAAVMSTTGYQCIRQENVVNMCSRQASEVVNKASGIIRSHNIYPWDYGAEEVDCRKVIKVGKGRQLLLKIETAQVDESRDTFRIRHIKGKTKTLVVEGNIKLFNTTLSGGSVELSLTVSRRSKTGKGFLVHFEKIGKRHRDPQSKHRKTSTLMKKRKQQNRDRRQRDNNGRNRNRRRKCNKSKRRKSNKYKSSWIKKIP